LSVTSGASNDPAQPLLDYDTESPPAPTAQSLNTGSGDAVLTVTASANDTGATTSTTSATISPPHLCADRGGINQTDGLPCGSSNARQGGISSASLTITEDGKKVGTAVLASTSAGTGVAFTDRAVSPEGAVCPQATG